MQPALPRKKRSLNDYATWAMIACGVILVLGLITWAIIVLMGKTSSDTGKTQAGAASVLEPANIAPSIRTIDSKLGIQIPYNSRELEGFGFADEVTFSNTDLDEARAYTIMRVRPVETSEATRSQVTLESPELRVTSSLNKAYWDSLSTKKEYKDLSKIDILVKETVTSRKQDKTIEAADTEVKNINNVDYRKVTFTSKNERYGVTTERGEDCYMTVQNDRPYVACINNIRASNFAVVPQLEQVLSQISYSAPDKSVLVDSTASASKDTKMLDNKQDEKVSVDTSSDEEATDKNESTKAPQDVKKIPSYLASTADFKTMAAAAPATVRIGTLYCADIKLTLPTTGGDGPTLTGACADKAGTGFFVSRDGLVATSGSTVQIKPQEAISAYITNAPDSDQALDRLQRILDYLVEGRIIMQTDADALMAGVEERNQDVIAKVNALSTRIAPEDIAVTKEKYSYAVQLADKPIVVNQNGDGSASFAYTDTVVDMSIEGKAYTADKTQEQIYAGDTVASDTALLRVKKNAAYPALPLALSGENVADKSTVNIVGMPMYAFGSLASAQFRATPMYRSGQVTQTFSGEAGQKVRAIGTSSHAGLAGAPVLDQQAQVVGMATYNNLNCQDRKCFASTVIRDTSDITNIAKQRNIVLQATSSSSETWNSAIEQLTRGNYKEATSLFNQASALYPQNYLAAQFAAYSKSQYGSATDTSTMNSIVSLLQVFALLAFGMLLLLAIVKVALRIIVKPHTETQYGQMAHGQYIDPSKWQHQNITAAQPPQTLAPLSSVPQPVSWQQPPQPQQASPQPGLAPLSQPAPQQPAAQAPQEQPPQYPPQQ